MQPLSSDNRAVLIYHPLFLEHDAGYGHPESPDRLRGILAALAQRGIYEDRFVRPKPADVGLVSEVHDPRYLAVLEKAARDGGGYWDADTHISPASYDAALLAAGAAVEAVDAVMSGTRSAFAFVRPPGHHALYDSAMGFCLLDNVAIAAHHAVRDHGLERVLIVDWDVHHGNGTQDLLYGRSDVMFYSTHQYPFYPGTGPVEQIGEGEGRGYNANMPLPAGTGDAGYIKVFHETLVPLARRYRPQLILISAGYDAHIADPLANMAVTVAGFGELAHIVRALADELCEGRVAAILEGGYNIDALGQSVVATLGMLEAPPSALRMPYDDGTTGDIAPHGGYGARKAPDVHPIIDRFKQIHGLQP